MTPFELELRKDCAVAALCADVLEEPREPWMEISFCRNCEYEKKDHTDEGNCLFAPMKFEAMSPAKYLEFLLPDLRKIYAPAEFPSYLEPSYVSAPYTVGIVTPSSYTICGSIVS